MSRLYIRVMTGFYTHRKTARLRCRLGDDAFWIPPRLWAYAAENQPDGNLAGYSSEELSELLGCRKHACIMLQALKDSGFVDSDGLIHDWKEHNGYHDKYAARAKTAAAARWAKERPPTPPKEDSGQWKGESGDKQCLPLETSIACSMEIQIYEAYPRKVGRPDALKAIRKSLLKVEGPRLLELTRAFSTRRRGQDPQFTPYPATWFNQERYNDDPSTWVTQTNGHTKPLTQSILND